MLQLLRAMPSSTSTDTVGIGTNAKTKTAVSMRSTCERYSLVKPSTPVLMPMHRMPLATAAPCRELKKSMQLRMRKGREVHNRRNKAKRGILQILEQMIPPSISRPVRR